MLISSVFKLTHQQFVAYYQWGQTERQDDIQTYKQTDIATYRLNWPRGRFSANCINYHCSVRKHTTKFDFDAFWRCEDADQ